MTRRVSCDCMHDLLNTAEKMMTMGGRLVYFYPVVRDDGFTDVKFPKHPCFTQVACFEKILSLRYSRHLVTMVKVRVYGEEVEEMARKKKANFKENHVRWLEEGNLHAVVFCPADALLNLAGEYRFDSDSKPKYRGKYV